MNTSKGIRIVWVLSSGSRDLFS